MVRISYENRWLEHNIAWQRIRGTGHRGKIMKKDVLAFLPENDPRMRTIKSPANREGGRSSNNVTMVRLTDSE